MKNEEQEKHKPVAYRDAQRCRSAPVPICCLIAIPKGRWTKERGIQSSAAVKEARPRDKPRTAVEGRSGSF
jgi:hypothetical protein